MRVALFGLSVFQINLETNLSSWCMGECSMGVFFCTRNLLKMRALLNYILIPVVGWLLFGVPFKHYTLTKRMMFTCTYVICLHPPVWVNTQLGTVSSMTESWLRLELPVTQGRRICKQVPWSKSQCSWGMPCTVGIEPHMTNMVYVTSGMLTTEWCAWN